ncbi:hypothetical protein PtA15_3A393 [Puccinia triticina]|uniref:Uncharacterized protein n=1 Tax=Puccinia triticina TaxID=208348 RepID=A0ABY7CGG0_9BASI|nr:uncharacterized protein PtA15_3A393 [Puccinia triticina]WAQ83027.1 hypothetical protein PtA15_3A393 [Puccinia triticina]WAR53861.1 hypothetical protein PtB15_3B370 [Puccinia triticina]
MCSLEDDSGRLTVRSLPTRAVLHNGGRGSLAGKASDHPGLSLTESSETSPGRDQRAPTAPAFIRRPQARKTGPPRAPPEILTLFPLLSPPVHCLLSL